MSKEKILLIDDEPDFRKMVTDMLISSDYECLKAKDGREGLMLAKECLPDLIICDIQMPYMDGYAVFHALRKDKRTNRIPFIFLSVKGSHNDIRTGMNIGADDYLPKPFSRKTLLSTIHSRLVKKDILDVHHEDKLKEIKKKLSHKLDYDELTGLPKQNIIDRVYNKLINKNVYVGGICILAISIDRFAFIQEAFGYRGRDSVIKTIVKHVKAAIGSDCTLFRLGINSFAVLALNIEKKEEAEALITKIIKSIKVRIKYRDYKLYVTASIGCRCEFFFDRDIKLAVEEAETALYNVQNEGGNGYRFYQREISRQAFGRFELESDLFSAEQNGEFRVFYQPQIEVRTGKIVGMESLIRWKHPKFGFVSPVLFIPIAEENGLICDIGQSVLWQACRKTQEWRKLYSDSLRLAVNVSAEQFKSGDFLGVVKTILKKSGLPPKNLELEITENIFVKDTDSIARQMNCLNEIGVNIAIDDFGTGYSSLSYLKLFPLSTLKIDRSFIQDITTSSTVREIVDTIVKMANSLGFKVLAEGIETEGQLDYIREIGVQEYQGYFFSKPVPDVDFTQMLECHKGA